MGNDDETFSAGGILPIDGRTLARRILDSYRWFAGYSDPPAPYIGERCVLPAERCVLPAERCVLSYPDPQPAPQPTATRQRVLVCVTCSSVIARSKEVPSVYDEPVLFASEMERGMRQHEAATGHRQARQEDRMLFVGEADGEA